MTEDLVLTDEEMVHRAFEWYCDFAVDVLVKSGLTEDDALDTLFSSAAAFHEDGIMPEFPSENATYIEEGQWLVKAKDEHFLESILESLHG